MKIINIFPMIFLTLTSACLSFGLATATAVADIYPPSKALVLEGGLTIQVPAGWTSQPPVASKVVLVPPVNDSLVIASIEAGDVKLAISELSNGIALESGVFLRPTATPRLVSSVYSNDFIAVGAPVEMRAAVMLRPLADGRIVTLFALAPPGQIEMLKNAMTGMMKGIKLAPAQTSSSSGELAVYLKGRYLVRFYSGNGYSEKHELWLCSNGQFRSRSDGGGFTQGVASGAFEGGRTGNWTALGSLTSGSLKLASSDGSVSNFEVREGSGGLMLNGQKWLRGENDVCN
jgi:hypothetical protein